MSNKDIRENTKSTGRFDIKSDTSGRDSIRGLVGAAQFESTIHRKATPKEVGVAYNLCKEHRKSLKCSQIPVIQVNES
jgi:hypothetical protein